MNKSNENTADMVNNRSAQALQELGDAVGRGPKTTEQIAEIAQILPFPHISACRRKLLVVAYDPDLAMMNVTDRCALAGVARRTYYDALQDPEYLAACKEMTRLAWAAMQPEMQGRYAELARSTKPGADKAIERILEQGESLREKAGPSVNVSVTMTAEQLAEKRHKNQAEGLRLLGLPVPEFLQVEDQSQPDNGNGSKNPSGRITVPEPATTCYNSSQVGAIKEDMPKIPDSGLDPGPNRPQIDTKQPPNSPTPATEGKPDDDF